MPCGYPHYVIEEVADEVRSTAYAFTLSSIILPSWVSYNSEKVLLQLFPHVRFPLAGADMTSHRSTTPTVSIAAAPR